MNLAAIHSIYKKLENDHLAFIYLGNFSNNVLALATDLIKYDIDDDSSFSSMSNKLSFLMIENFQNIIRYSDNKDVETENEKVSKEVFMTRHIGDSFFITSANLVENQKIEDLKNKLQLVNTLDRDELKMLYIEVLTNRKISKQGGAGLGFIEMVRKTNEKLDFDFIPENNEYSLFYFQIKLRGRNSETEKVVPNIPMQDVMGLHKQLLDENVLMVHRGDFSSEALTPVFRMVENNIDNQEIARQKKIFHVLVEVLQNLSKHSLALNGLHQGIFMLSKFEGKTEIATGNFIDSHKVEALKSHLEIIQGMSHTELNKYYKQMLNDGEDSADGNAGLGLVDIARESKEKIEFEFTPVNDKISFFSFLVKQ